MTNINQDIEAVAEGLRMGKAPGTPAMRVRMVDALAALSTSGSIDNDREVLEYTRRYLLRRGGPVDRRVADAIASRLESDSEFGALRALHAAASPRIEMENVGRPYMPDYQPDADSKAFYEAAYEALPKLLDDACGPRAALVTSSTITDEQIRALLVDLREDARACYAAISTPWKFATPEEVLAHQQKRERGRARCAEILNARSGGSK